MTPARQMKDPEIAKELEDLGKRWDAADPDDEGAAGSPGEWMVERMGELEQEQDRRRTLDLSVGSRVNVSLGRGFGGYATITDVLYRVEYDHDQPAGGKFATIHAHAISKIEDDPKPKRKRKGKRK